MDRMIAFCGLVCTECPAFIATQKDEEEGLKRVAVKWSEQFNASIGPEDCICDGCLAFEARLSSYCRECKISACSIEKKVQNCAYCNDYPCHELDKFFTLASDAKATLEGIRQSLSE